MAFKKKIVKSRSAKSGGMPRKLILFFILSAVLLGLFFSFKLFFHGEDNSGVPEAYVAEDDPYLNARLNMVEFQLRSRGIHDLRVLDAMSKVPRHLFMPHSRHLAYEDHPVPIGYAQTISQPYIVALMIQELGLGGNEKVLEIGAGSGYNAAVLAEVAEEVYTIEIVGELAEWSGNALKKAGYSNVHVKHADGYFGWPGMEFDVVIITAAANHVPHPLIEQLKDGGRIILPLSSPAGFQALTLITKAGENLDTRIITGVRFVPMTGRMLE